MKGLENSIPYFFYLHLFIGVVNPVSALMNTDFKNAFPIVGRTAGLLVFTRNADYHKIITNTL